MRADEADRLVLKNLPDHVKLIPLVEAAGSLHERLKI
jgi:hypothetical protein